MWNFDRIVSILVILLKLIYEISERIDGTIVLSCSFGFYRGLWELYVNKVRF